MANIQWPPAGASTLAQTLILNDATTNTAPDGVIERHTTSGTAAANFGLTDAVELQSGGGTTRRVMTVVNKLTTATDAAEIATRIISLMDAGTLQVVLTLIRGMITVGTDAGSGSVVQFGGCKITQDGTNVNLNLLPGSGRDIVCGASGALATNATLGFLQIPTCAGTPTGTLGALQTGKAAIVYDTTGSKIWLSTGGGTWKGVVVA